MSCHSRDQRLQVDSLGVKSRRPRLLDIQRCSHVPCESFAYTKELRAVKTGMRHCGQALSCGVYRQWSQSPFLKKVSQGRLHSCLREKSHLARAYFLAQSTHRLATSVRGLYTRETCRDRAAGGRAELRKVAGILFNASKPLRWCCDIAVGRINHS